MNWIAPIEKDTAEGAPFLCSQMLTPEFVYVLARSDEFRGININSMTGASGRHRMQEKCFDEFLTAYPTPVFLDRFSATVAPSFHMIQ